MSVIFSGDATDISTEGNLEAITNCPQLNLLIFMDTIQFHFQSSQSSTDRDPKYALKDGITEDKKAALV